VLIGLTLLAVVWAAERYGFVGQVAPDPIPVDRHPEAAAPPPPTDLAAADGAAEEEAPSPTEAPSGAEAAPRAESSGDRDSAGSAAPPAPRRSKPKPTPQAAPRAPPTAADPLVIDGLSLRDSSGRTIYRGQIDLAPTLERIAAGRRLRFPNDGTTFQNRENRLPRRPPGYYREWVVPTPKEPGPGPQRLITGEEGEVWYTSDHYRSFRRIPTEIRTR
jgi:guanyl-specific ribonuclease Sa